MAQEDKRTDDGLDVQMQTNQLSHFVLTKNVFKSLEMAAENRGEARVVTQSSFVRDFRAKLQEKYFMKCEAGSLGGDRYVEVV
jgi:hypothetical protein